MATNWKLPYAARKAAERADARAARAEGKRLAREYEAELLADRRANGVRFAEWYVPTIRPLATDVIVAAMEVSL